MGTIARTDHELVEASRRGEREAFAGLVTRYQDIVWAVSFGSTGDRALGEDVAQETFIAAWRQLDQLRDIVRIRPWLCGIARNLARKARVRARREQPRDDLGDEPIAGDASPFDHAAQAESEAVVRAALARVPDGYREVLVLYYRENRSIADVAELLGLSEAAALQRLARGRKHLADGVSELVERSLRGARPRRDLVAGVVAAIAAFGGGSRVDASPQTKGSTMLKIAMGSGLLAAAVTTAYVVHAAKTDAPVATAAAHASAAMPSPSPTPTPKLIPRPSPTPNPGPNPNPNPNPMPNNRAPDPDDVPTVSAEDIAKLKLYEGPARGPANAPVTIVVFQDNMCTYCGKVLGTIDQLMDEYPNKLRLVVKQFPVHEAARLSSEASFAADAQGKFWELHDLMLAHQDDLSHDALIAYARQAGLDVATFTAALDHHDYAAALAADQAEGKAIDVRGTPAFLINGRRFVGARPIEDFRAAIDSALAD